MEYIDVTTQDELEDILKKGNIPNLRGNGEFSVSGSATVRAYGHATVTAFDSATVTAFDSATVTAFDSATVRAYGSATVRASGSATVRASGSATVRASKFVGITIHGKDVKSRGGRVIRIPVIETASAWFEFYGVNPKNGVAVLFKAVGKDFKSKRGMLYAPGSKPKAPDWDGGEEECGGGLHFSPHPFMALKFDYDAVKFVGCPVKVSEIVVHKKAQYPDKVKAPRVFGPCFEVDIDGNPIKAKED